MKLQKHFKDNEGQRASLINQYSGLFTDQTRPTSINSQSRSKRKGIKLSKTLNWNKYLPNSAVSVEAGKDRQRAEMDKNEYYENSTRTQHRKQQMGQKSSIVRKIKDSAQKIGEQYGIRKYNSLLIHQHSTTSGKWKDIINIQPVDPVQVSQESRSLINASSPAQKQSNGLAGALKHTEKSLCTDSKKLNRDAFYEYKESTISDHKHGFNDKDSVKSGHKDSLVYSAASKKVKFSYDSPGKPSNSNQTNFIPLNSQYTIKTLQNDQLPKSSAINQSYSLSFTQTQIEPLNGMQNNEKNPLWNVNEIESMMGGQRAGIDKTENGCNGMYRSVIGNSSAHQTTETCGNGTNQMKKNKIIGGFRPRLSEMGRSGVSQIGISGRQSQTKARIEVSEVMVDYFHSPQE